jgi:trimeric autotransporter adhesin
VGWGNISVGIGTLGTAPVGTGATAPGFYSGNTNLRVAFKGPGTNPVTYYTCKERFNTGSARNCTVISTGSYTIATLGDARVMTLNNLPSQTLPLTFTRVFVERGGLVHTGYQNKLIVTNSARLNLKATNELFTKLGLPVVDVATPLALTKTSYAGNWEVFDNAVPLQSTVLSLKNDGTATCTDTDGTLTPAVVSSKACNVTFSNLVNGDFTVTAPGSSPVTGNANFLTGAISGSYTDNSVTPPVTGTFSGSRR